MNDGKPEALGLIAGVCIVVLSLVTAGLGGCDADHGAATRALNAVGIHDVRFGGYAWFACSKNDHFSSTFTGTGADGKPVSGVVCQGLLKDVTVRFD
ncbi:MULTISPECIES: hypothetical protein [unclassified Mesorhizobium]|uniref:hypothetical protein n=1 Tax=unclassified Mesorhizobium TaxID=325217 RepID=UPI000FD89AFB|nr:MULTISPECIES: hypothetical protein [unclassified Mesorhizobium]TGT64061.1 hypothetical protein EN809_034970 [Mesorhizobium sp. M2E.F.Ca.ET.166.01.1.1]TGV97055.1 hypothetical protein EN797_035190 [Mesorhizobium sp. M2E.F.Ca.ET.154.01.1.1]